MTVERIDGINHPAVIPIAAEGWAYITRRGMAESSTLLHFDQDAIVAREGDEVIGVIAYSDMAWKKEVYLQLGYVQPAHRRKGVYRALWNELVKIAQEKKRLRISGGTHITNHEMQEAMRHLGRKAAFVTYYFDVPEKVDEQEA